MSLQICKIYFLLRKIQEDILKNIDYQTVLVTIDFHCMNKNKTQRHFSNYFLFCSTEERKSCRFETTCEWVNDDRIKKIWVNYSLNAHLKPINLMALFM